MDEHPVKKVASELGRRGAGEHGVDVNEGAAHPLHSTSSNRTHRLQSYSVMEADTWSSRMSLFMPRTRLAEGRRLHSTDGSDLSKRAVPGSASPTHTLLTSESRIPTFTYAHTAQNRQLQLVRLVSR